MRTIKTQHKLVKLLAKARVHYNYTKVKYTGLKLQSV